MTESYLELGCDHATLASIPQLVDADLMARIYYDGRFIANIDADILTLGPFSLGQADVTLTNFNPDNNSRIPLPQRERGLVPCGNGSLWEKRGHHESRIRITLLRIRRRANPASGTRGGTATGSWGCLKICLLLLALLMGGCCIFSAIPRERVRVKLRVPVEKR